MLFAHWVACIWGYTAAESPEGEGWISSKDLYGAPPFHKFTVAFYFAVMTITTGEEAVPGVGRLCYANPLGDLSWVFAGGATVPADWSLNPPLPSPVPLFDCVFRPLNSFWLVSSNPQWVTAT